MAWVRIHDAALSHPKIVGLVDWKNPFCLWVWGLSYCQTHLTDGVIPAAAIPNRLAERTAVKLVLLNLWEAQDGGFKVHDYLEWNDSRDSVLRKRSEAKERMTNARQRSSREHIPRTSSEVLRGVGKSTTASERTEEIGLEGRAGRLREELYPSWYAKYRNGARLRLIANSLEFQDALSLVSVWDDAHLEKLARIILTTDDDWISRTDRGFKIFALKASWADDRLKEWEAKRRQG